MTRLHAVLTGDIVHSSDISSAGRERLSRYIAEAYELVQSRYGDSLPYPISQFRGDSWQVYSPNPKHALAIAVHLFVRLRVMAGVDDEEVITRVAIAIGRADFIREENIGLSDGEAFRESGSILSEMEQRKRNVPTFRAKLLTNPERMQSIAFEQTIDVVDHLAPRWSLSSAIAVSLKLTHPEATQSELASRWPTGPTTQSNVSQSLSQAHWKLVDSTLRRFQEIMEIIQNAAD